MIKYLAILLFSVPAMADWICDQDSAQRRGNDFAVCGTAVAVSEEFAREKAFQSAVAHFNELCRVDGSCQSVSHSIEDKRSQCLEIAPGKFKCQRMIVAHAGLDRTDPLARTGTGDNASANIERPIRLSSSECWRNNPVFFASWTLVRPLVRVFTKLPHTGCLDGAL